MPLVRQKEVLINGDSEINSVGRAESAVLLNIITRLIHLRGDLQLTNLNKKLWRQCDRYCPRLLGQKFCTPTKRATLISHYSINQESKISSY